MLGVTVLPRVREARSRAPRKCRFAKRSGEAREQATLHAVVKSVSNTGCHQYEEKGRVGPEMDVEMIDGACEYT